VSIPTTDSAAIKQIINGLTEGGCRIESVFDGEEYYPVGTRAEAVRYITNITSAYLNVRLPDESHGYILFVPGNDPEEVAVNWTESLHPFIDPVVNPWLE